MPIKAIIAGLIALTLAGCSRETVTLHTMRSTDRGPEEFSIVPVKALEQPQNYAELPAPTPGAANLADHTPVADAVVALGGRPSTQTGIAASDAGLVNYAGRKGTDPNIRTELAEVDEKFRKRNARFSRVRLFAVDRYAQAYRRQALKPEQVANTYRRAGVRTPSNPPAGN